MATYAVVAPRVGLPGGIHAPLNLNFRYTIFFFGASSAEGCPWAKAATSNDEGPWWVAAPFFDSSLA